MGKYFGTDGFRGVANRELKGNLAYRIGRFLGYYKNGSKNKVLIARDTRLSGQLLADCLAAGVVASGSDAYNLGVSTTPSISYLVRKYHFDFGVMISASHNPYYDNGIKVFNKDGEKLEESVENLIEKYLDSRDDDIPLAINENIGHYPSVDKYLDDYIDFLVSKASPLVSKSKILVDCANGSASVLIDELLEKLGVNATIVNASPNGLNINDRCGSTHIKYLAEVVKKANYDIAFAFDGDTDRCLAMDSQGNIIDGDAIMYLNAMYLKKNHQLNHDTVVLSVMSNLGLKIAFKKQNILVKEVSVGDKYVQAELKSGGYSLGGEQSGHIIFLGDMNTGDGLLTMIKILNILSVEKKAIQELIKGLVIYPQVLKNVASNNKDAILAHPGLNEFIKRKQIELADEGRILVRASGTEPLIRVMCEAKSLEECNKICDEIVNYISEIQ